MTPEQRADAVYRQYSADPVKGWRRPLIAAIRAAENDALDRAAAEAERLDFDQYGMAGEVVAARIRVLRYATEPAN